eukprot:9439144-Alexandrium_andersonii.AAC.1
MAGLYCRRPERPELHRCLGRGHHACFTGYVSAPSSTHSHCALSIRPTSLAVGAQPSWRPE